MNQVLLPDNSKILLKILKFLSLDELVPLRLVNSTLNQIICKKCNSLSRLRMPSSSKNFFPSPQHFISLVSIELEYCQILTDKKGVNQPFNRATSFLRALPCPEKITTFIVKNFRIKCQVLEVDFWRLLNFHFPNLTSLTFSSPLSPLIRPAFPTTILPLQATVLARLEHFCLTSRLPNQGCSLIEVFNILLLLSPDKLKQLELRVNWRSSWSSKLTQNPQVHLTGKWAESCKGLASKLGQFSTNESPSIGLSLYDIFGVMSKFSRLSSLKLTLEANSISASMLNLPSHNYHNYFFFPLKNLTLLELHIKVNSVTEVIEALSGKTKTEDFPFNLAFFEQFIPQVACPNLKVLKCKFTLDGSTFERVNERL